MLRHPVLASLAVALAAGAAWAQDVLFADHFDRPDGQITSANSSDWDVTSGSFYVRGGVGQANDPVFRADTKRGDFGDVTVSLRLKNNGVSGAAQSFDGF